MKKGLVILLLIATMLGNFTTVYAAVNQNGGGLPGGSGGGGQDTCTGDKQYCPRGWSKVVAYRLTFVYAKDGNYKMPLNANNPSKKADSLDVWSEAWRCSSEYNYTKTKYIKNYGTRIKAQASKIEYLKAGVDGTPKSPFKRVVNRSVGGYKFITDSQLNTSIDFTNKKNKCKGLAKFVDKYDGRAVMEYFTGTLNSNYQELVRLARKMNIIKATEGLDDLYRISKDEEGYVLKLLIEPIAEYMHGPGSNFLGGYFTVTEIAMIMNGKLKASDGKKYSIKTGDKNRSRCVFPLRAYLVVDDVELGFNAYDGPKNCKNTEIPKSTILNHLGVMVVDMTNLPAPVEKCNPAEQCCEPPCSKVVFRTISLSNPFPGHNAQKRTPGSNWLPDDEDVDQNILIKEYILNNRGVESDKVYNLTPMYKITLTPSLIKEIRNYNKTVNNYNDDSVTMCSVIKDEDGTEMVDEKTCKSTFIHKTYSANFSGCGFDGSCIKIERNLEDELEYALENDLGGDDEE